MNKHNEDATIVANKAILLEIAEAYDKDEIS